jgi:hypothetical protein
MGDNIPWQKHFIWGSVNMYVYHWGIRQPGEGHTGIFSNREELLKVTNLAFPTLVQEFRPFAERKYDLAQVLARKARNGRPEERGGKNALVTRFEDREIWRKSSTFLRKVVDNPRPIDPEELMLMQDRAQKVAYDKKPGFYITVHSRHYNDVRVGSAKNIAKRVQAHKGYGYLLVRGYPTASPETAEQLEDAVLALMRGEFAGHVEWEPDGAEGHFILKPDINAVERLDQLIRDKFRWFFHQTAEYDRIPLWVPK